MTLFISNAALARMVTALATGNPLPKADANKLIELLRASKKRRDDEVYFLDKHPPVDSKVLVFDELFTGMPKGGSRIRQCVVEAQDGEVHLQVRPIDGQGETFRVHLSQIMALSQE